MIDRRYPNECGAPSKDSILAPALRIRPARAARNKSQPPRRCCAQRFGYVFGVARCACMIATLVPIGFSTDGRSKGCGERCARVARDKSQRFDEARNMHKRSTWNARLSCSEPGRKGCERKVLRYYDDLIYLRFKFRIFFGYDIFGHFATWCHARTPGSASGRCTVRWLTPASSAASAVEAPVARAAAILGSFSGATVRDIWRHLRKECFVVILSLPN
jgi:hypothetical protein